MNIILHQTTCFVSPATILYFCEKLLNYTLSPQIPARRKFFADEMERQRKSVRLIFQGRELKPSAAASRDSPSRRRLCDYGVSDNATIHCLISDAPPQSSSSSSSRSTASPMEGNVSMGPMIHTNFGATEDLDFGSQMMMPLFAFLLSSVWLFRFFHAEYFSLISTVALVCLSALFAGAVFSSMAANRRPVETGRVFVAAGDALQT